MNATGSPCCRPPARGLAAARARVAGLHAPAPSRADVSATPSASSAPASASASASVAQAVRELRFAKGESRVRLQGAVIRGERACFAFRAKRGQRAPLAPASPEAHSALQVYAPGARPPAEDGGDVRGAPLPGAADGDDATGWSGTLPASGRYLVVVGPTRGNASDTLELAIGR